MWLIVALQANEPKKLSWLRAIGLKLRQATGIIAIVGVTLWVS